MSKLNCKTDTTKKIIHLLVTSLCNRNCKHCCNKQYNLNDVQHVTDEELREAEIICITGGEPFFIFKSLSDICIFKKKVSKHKGDLCLYKCSRTIILS